MGKPKLLYLSTSLNIGGTEKFLVTLAQNLKSEYDLTIGFLKEKGYWGEWLEKNGFLVINFRFPWDVVFYLKKNNIDIIHTYLYRANILGRVSGRMAGTKAVISTQQAVDIWKMQHLVLLDRVTSGCCDSLVVNSLAAKESVQRRERFPAGKVCVIYNGIDHEVYTVSKSKEEIREELRLRAAATIIVSVARLHREKGMDYVPMIAREVPDAVFLIVGEGPERAGMEARIKKGGMQDRFVFLGWRQDIPSILKASDIFLLPSREESFPQAILEAMAMKTPVVASDIGGVKELVEPGRTGILVKPADIGGFADGLNRLMRHKTEARQMAENGYQRSLLYSEKDMIARMDSLYKNFLAPKTARAEGKIW